MSDRKVLDMRVAGSQFKTPSHPRVRLSTVQDLLAKVNGTLSAVESNASSQEAFQIMQRHDVSALLVTNSARAVGILCERDCARAAFDGSGCGTSTCVRDLMSPCTVSIKHTDSLDDCLRLMNENHTRFVLVLDGEETIGLVSREQVLNELVLYLERVFHEYELDRQIVFLRGTYSC